MKEILCWYIKAIKSHPERGWKKFKREKVEERVLKKIENNLGKKCKVERKVWENVRKIGEKKLWKKFYVGTKKVMCWFKKVQPRERLKKVQKFKSWGMSFKKNWNNLEKKLKLKEKFGKIFGKIGEKKVEKKVETKFYVGTQKVICQWKKSHPERGWKKLKKSCERSLKKFEIVEISSGKSWKYVGNIGEKKVEKNWEKSVMLKLVGIKQAPNGANLRERFAIVGHCVNSGCPWGGTFTLCA